MTNGNLKSKSQPSKVHPKLTEFVARIIATAQDYSTEELSIELGFTKRQGLQKHINKHRKGGESK